MGLVLQVHEDYLKIIDQQNKIEKVKLSDVGKKIPAMKKGDLVLFYHSNEGLEVVGVAKVSKEHYPDPTAEGDTWSVVNLKPVKKLKCPVSLATIKSDSRLEQIQLLRLNRLSVTALTPHEFDIILQLGETVIK